MRWRLGVLLAQWLAYVLLSRNLDPLWSYSGIAFSNPELVSVIAAIACLILTAVMLPSSTSRPSDFALWLLASFLVVPTLAVSTVNPIFDYPTRALASGMVVAALSIVALLLRPRGILLEITGPGLMSRSMFCGLVAGAAFVAAAIIVVGYGVSTFDLSFSNEYDRRIAVRELHAPFPGASYLVAWLLSPLIPLMVVIGVQWARLGMILSAFAYTLVVFAFDGQKSVFVFPVLALLMLLSARRAQVGISSVLFGGSVSLALIVGPMLVTRIFPASKLDYLLTRRIGLDPGLLTHYYVQYAADNGFTKYEHVVARFLGPDVDSRSIGYRVGDWLNPGVGSNANANLWAEAYVSAGLLGVIIASVLLAFVLRTLDQLAGSRDSLVASPALGTACFAYVNGAFQSSLLTGGIIFACALVWAMPDPRYRIERVDDQAVRIGATGELALTPAQVRT